MIHGDLVDATLSNEMFAMMMFYPTFCPLPVNGISDVGLCVWRRKRTQISISPRATPIKSCESPILAGTADQNSSQCTKRNQAPDMVITVSPRARAKILRSRLSEAKVLEESLLTVNSKSRGQRGRSYEVSMANMGL